MKKLITLVIAGVMVLGSLATASAVDVKVGGGWWFHYGYASNPNLQDKSKTGKHGDRFRARQRVRTQIQFIADENLSAMLSLEANMVWGDANKDAGSGPYNTHGALDADGATFVVRHAYLNWAIPNTQVKTRIGIQGIAMPGFAAGNPVMSTDVAGISVATQFTPEVGLTVFWARAYDEFAYESEEDGIEIDSSGQAKGKNFSDEVDVFGLALPIKTSVVRFTPWAMGAFIGKDSYFWANKKNYNGASVTTPKVFIDNSKFDNTGYGWWLGSSFEFPILDPFYVKLDAIVGGLETGDSAADTTGWFLATDIGYKASFAELGILGFYSSGSDKKDDHGFLPQISNNSTFNMNVPMGGFYGLASSDWRRYDGYLTNSGQGMWGLGFKVANVSFVDNLKHTLLGMYYGGTNDGDFKGNRRDVADFGSNKALATSDHAWEITLLNEYKVSQNLSFRYDLGYIQLELGDSWKNKGDTKGNVYTGIGIQYSF